MKEEIKVVIDGNEIIGHEGMTILEAAESAGLKIPTLCHRDDLSPTGACRVCVVEVEENPRLVGSCHTPIVNGMNIRTQSGRVLAVRKTIVELMLSGHTGPCVNDSRLEECKLHQLASDLEVGSPRFPIPRPRFYSVEEISPYVRRELSKCIMCRICVKACEEIAKKNIYSVGYRGFASKVIVDCDEQLNKEDCANCGVCIDYCPTSALSRPEGFAGDGVVATRPKTEKEDEGSVEEDREKLLEILKREQQESGYISREAVIKVSKRLNISVSEVYGVASFYSFLSLKPLGRNAIRICKSLPCYLKHSAMIIESVKNTIGIGPGETTPDNRFSLELTNCIGACDMGPAMLINHDIHGNLSADKIPEILNSYL